MTKNQTSFKPGNDYWKRAAKELVGRPSKYKPEYCDQVIAMGKHGLCVPEMASQFNVCRSTLSEWAKKHPEFSKALARAVSEGEAHLYRYGIKNLENKSFQASMWEKIMRARFRENWTESKSVELTGPNGGAIQLQAIQEKEDELEGIVATALTRDETARTESAGAGSGSESDSGIPLALAYDRAGQSASSE